MTRNISATGVLLEAAESLPVHGVVEMTVQLGEPLGQLPAGRLSWVTTVARRQPATEARFHLTGLRIVERRRETKITGRDAAQTPPMTFVDVPSHQVAPRADSGDAVVSASSPADDRCPKCGSTHFYRVPRRRRARLLSWLSRRRPYHCKSCDRLSWVLPAG